MPLCHVLHKSISGMFDTLGFRNTANIVNIDFCDFALIGQMNAWLFFLRCGMILDIFHILVLFWALNVLRS